MNRKTIDDVRHEFATFKDKAARRHAEDVKRAESAEREAIKQRARADAYEGALMAVLADMKRLGLIMSVKEMPPGALVTNPGLPQHGVSLFAPPGRDVSVK